MEYLVHICGARIARHEHGGIAGSVIYGEPAATGRELHACPQCAAPLDDRGVFRIAHADTETICTAVTGHTRFAFPFRWSAGGRAYIYEASQAPRVELRHGDSWQTVALVAFGEFERWMRILAD